MTGEAIELHLPESQGTHAMPSGPVPVEIFFVTCQVLRSTTAMKLSPLTAT